NPDYGDTIPQTPWMIDPLMFAIITPGLICGAYAERMKFSSMVIFSLLWLLLVYCPLAHMVWGKGGLFNWSRPPADGLWKNPSLDFAGGTVVHISSGVSALMCGPVMRKRRGYGRVPKPPQTDGLSGIGACG